MSSNKLTVLLATAVMLFGSWVPGKAAEQPTNAPPYVPCIKGPETLRFFDRSFADKQNLQGDEINQFVSRLPPLAYQRYARALEKLLAELEPGTIKNSEELKQILNRVHLPSLADVAEEYIADCSQQLGNLSAVAAMPDMRSVESIARLWQTNLDFMKWWLVNHREKNRTAR